MAASKTLVFLKLSVLVGGPLCVLLGLVGTGIYLGDAHRDTVLSVEAALLGKPAPGASSTDAVDEGTTGGVATPVKDVSAPAEAPPAAADAKAPASDGSTSSPGAPPAPVKTAAKPDVPPPSPTADEEVSSAATDRTPPAEREVAPMPVDRQPPAAVPEAPAPSLPPMATAPAVPDDLLGAYAAPRVLSVRVLVDDTLVRARPDWIDYVQQLVSISSANTSALLGLTLELRGVGRWDGEARAVAASGRGLDAITRDGADVVVLLGERGDAAAAAGGIPPHASGAALVPSVASRRIGGWAVVLGDARDTFSHQGSLMHELGHLLGAEDIADVRAAGWGSGSFMSLAPLADDAAPAIDEENLRRILNRKSWPAARGDEDAEVNHDK